MTGEQSSILQPGKNCWRIEKIRRASFLIDAAEYFETLAAAIGEANSSIYIAGWDIDSRVTLRPSQNGHKRGVKLGELIDSRVAEKPDLHVYILVWDFAMIYAGQREWLPFFASNWRASNRIRFHFDGEHPIGASHHQKLVVLDNALAFCGGIDLTGNRWDTPEHAIRDPRRVNPGGGLYGPFHDVQMMVEGDAAAALGELFRQRWLDAIGDKIGSDTGRPAASWPRSRQVDLADTMVAISRTLPAYKGRSEVREIEALYRDAIAAARNFIYIENQYLTSAAVIDALRQSLTNEAGPEIVLVLPYQSDGWLARSTMDAIRSRAGNELREVDSHHRLRIVHPVLNESDSPLFVHSKIMVVDDGLITIGSANLNNRSMGLDSECNLAVAAVENRQVANALARFRNRLVAEHLGVKPDEVAEAIARQGSLIETITELGGRSGRHLKELDCTSTVWLDGVRLVQDPSLFDPEEPTKIDCILDQFVHEHDERYEVRGLLKIGLVALILIGIAAAWRWTPLAELIDIRKLATAVHGLRGSFLLPLLSVGVYMVASFLMVPVSLLIGTTAILFPSIWGVIYALTGCLLSSAAHYLVGSKLGKNTVRKLAGPKLNRLSKRLSKDGWLAIMLIRNLPVAPFALVNMIAGASHIKFKDFLLGTALGMAPGIVAIVLFADRLLMALAEPGLLNALLATAAAALVAIGIWVIRRRISHEEHPERA